MKKFYVLLFLLFLSVLSLLAQAQTNAGKIKGTVIDGNSKTIESSTITLLRSKDSSVIKISAADKDGHFEFENIPEGKYLVSVSAVGHQKGYSEVFEVTNDKNSIELKTLELVPVATAIGGVTVNVKKPFIEQKPGKTIINVDASPTNAGLNVLELLEKSPGVSVDNDN